MQSHFIFLGKMQTKKNDTHKKSLPLEAGTIPNHKPWNTMKFRPSQEWGGSVESKLNTLRGQNLQKQMELRQGTQATITYVEEESLRPQVVCGSIRESYFTAEVNREGASK